MHNFQFYIDAYRCNVYNTSNIASLCPQPFLRFPENIQHPPDINHRVKESPRTCPAPGGGLKISKTAAA